VVRSWGVLVFYGYQLLRVKKTYKVLNRSEVERLKFIERMSQNKVIKPMFLYKGKKMLGRITHLKEFAYKGNPKGDNILIDQFVVKPILFGKIPNPFTKSRVFQIGVDSMDISNFKFVIKPYTYLDYYFGVYYDEDTKAHTEIIKNDNVIRTDLNQLASIYFVKSQEQSTYDPVHAHALALKEKELQIELAKKRGKAETI